MAIANTTEVFGFYEVSRDVLNEFAGQTLFDVFCELSALSLIDWDEDKDRLTLILKPKCPEQAGRTKDLTGLLFNVLGLADSFDIEDVIK